MKKAYRAIKTLPADAMSHDDIASEMEENEAERKRLESQLESDEDCWIFQGYRRDPQNEARLSPYGDDIQERIYELEDRWTYLDREANCSEGCCIGLTRQDEIEALEQIEAHLGDANAPLSPAAMAVRLGVNALALFALGVMFTVPWFVEEAEMIAITRSFWEGIWK